MSAIELTISKSAINVDVTVPAQTVDLTITGTSPKWGSINGTLSNQTDLQTALNAKLSLTGGTMTGGLTISNFISTGYNSPLTTSTTSTYAARFTQLGTSTSGTIALGSNDSGNYIQSFGTRPLVFNSVGNNSFFYNKVGIAAQGTTLVAPTHSLTLLSTADGIAQYNTTDTITNYERARGFWSGSVYNLATEAGGTGTIRAIKLATINNFSVSINSASTSGMASVQGSSGVASSIGLFVNPTTTASSGRAYGLSIVPVVNQSSTAAYSALHINPTETAVGSGLNYLAHFQVGGVTKLIVNTNGSIQLPGSSSNSMTRPAVSSTEVPGEINGYSSGNLALDDGFLRLSAGGGTNPLTKSYIDLSGYSTIPDMSETIVMGTLGDERLRIKGNGLIEIPTGNGLALYNTADQVTDYERFRMFYSSNIFNITGEIGGTGTQRQLRITAKGNQFDMNDVSSGFTFTRASTALNIFTITSTNMAASSGSQVMLNLTPTIAHSGTAGYYGIYMNVTESSTGSGTKRLLDLAVGGSSKFNISSVGTAILAGALTVGNAGGSSSITMNYRSATTFSDGLVIKKRGTTGDDSAALTNLTEVGYHSFYGWTGTTDKRLAYVIVRSKGATSDVAGGGSYRINTRSDASNTEADRLIIDESGLTISEGHDIIIGTSTGTKLGTTSSQKLGFWNATPIAQPTTAVAAAAFVASAGTAVNDASTFDGYTIKQVVKALRNEGLLA